MKSARDSRPYARDTRSRELKCGIDDGVYVVVRDEHGVIYVARWLTTKPPVLPVVIHTTNTVAGGQMESLFAGDGWIHARVVPYDGEIWIKEHWRAIVRTLIVSHAPSITVSSAGVEVLRHGLQKGLPVEETVREILRVAVFHSHGQANADELCFEVAYLSREDTLKSIVGAGFSLLGEFGLGATRAVIEGSMECFGMGPIASTHESVEPIFRNHLSDSGVLEIQLDVIQPAPGHQAVLLTGNRSTRLNLSCHEIQANIRAVKSLLELGLLVALREFRDDLDVQHQPEVWSE